MSEPRKLRIGEVAGAPGPPRGRSATTRRSACCSARTRASPAPTASTTTPTSSAWASCSSSSRCSASRSRSCASSPRPRPPAPACAASGTRGSPIPSAGGACSRRPMRTSTASSSSCAAAATRSPSSRPSSSPAAAACATGCASSSAIPPSSRARPLLLARLGLEALARLEHGRDRAAHDLGDLAVGTVRIAVDLELDQRLGAELRPLLAGRRARCRPASASSVARARRQERQWATSPFFTQPAGGPRRSWPGIQRLTTPQRAQCDSDGAPRRREGLLTRRWLPVSAIEDICTPW